MKLSDFNTEELHQMKQACIDTRAKYDGYKDHQIPKWDGNTCPLCSFSNGVGRHTCKRCPWMVLEKRMFSEVRNPCQSAMFDTQKTCTRRNRLDRWIKLIDEEISHER